MRRGSQMLAREIISEVLMKEGVRKAALSKGPAIRFYQLGAVNDAAGEITAEGPLNTCLDGSKGFPC